MITKLGTDYFKGQKQDIYLIASTVTSDGELKSTQSGKTFGTCSCKAMEKEDGTAVWVAVKSFNELVRDRIARAGKGTPFLAWGRVETREYNGKGIHGYACRRLSEPVCGRRRAYPHAGGQHAEVLPRRGGRRRRAPFLSAHGMTGEAVSRILSLLSAYFPNRKITPDLQRAWQLALKPYDYKDVKAQVVRYVRRSKFFPDVADITAALPEPERRNGENAGKNAWMGEYIKEGNNAWAKKYMLP